MAKKKNVSSWKQKKSYTILAPPSFDGVVVGKTMGLDDKGLLGRTVDASLRDLSGDRSKQHLKVMFEIIDVKDDQAVTHTKKFTTSQGYLKSRVRKGTTKLDYQFELKTKDDVNARIKLMVLARGSVQDSTKKDLHKVISSIVAAQKTHSFEDLVQQAVYGKLGTEVYQKAKKVNPLSRVEAWQIKRL